MKNPGALNSGRTLTGASPSPSILAQAHFPVRRPRLECEAILALGALPAQGLGEGDGADRPLGGLLLAAVGVALHDHRARLEVEVGPLERADLRDAQARVEGQEAEGPDMRAAAR